MNNNNKKRILKNWSKKSKKMKLIIIKIMKNNYNKMKMKINNKMN